MDAPASGVRSLADRGKYPNPDHQRDVDRLIVAENGSEQWTHSRTSMAGRINAKVMLVTDGEDTRAQTVHSRKSATSVERKMAQTSGG